MSRILVAVEGEVTMRAAQTLSAHPGVESISLLGPAKSSFFPTTNEAEGHDIVVGGDLAAQVGLEVRIPAAVWGDLGDQDGLSRASIEGLALALAVGVDGVEVVAVATPGNREGDEALMFPSPIDSVPTTTEKVDGHEIHFGASPESVSAAMVRGRDIDRVIIDDHAFMRGIALAAAAATLIEQPAPGGDPVWTRSSSYLRAAVEMGLVIGERTPTG